ncbi:MAG: proline--tRNA ligase, partial [Candidatus Bathyarchaeia archaeon]
AEIYDYRYPIKGCGVWRPYGFKLRSNILNLIRRHLDETGHEEALFPLLIPEDFLAKESTHIKSFEDESYWITHGGSDRLDVKLALRPTSETAITPMVKLWVRSHADLPKILYQIGSIFRYETKATRPMIRVREITTFKEAHTFHTTHEDSIRQVHTANEVYKRIFDELHIPYLVSKRPDWDKFAGALTSYAFDTVFPDGRALQIGTTHDLGQNFGRAFDFTFETVDGKRDYVWQTCYGISERLVATVVTIHGDDRGLVLPPKVAPIQVVIVPIPYKGVEAEVNEECKRVEETLIEAGLRVKLDDRGNVTPGSKFYDWELRGVPIRVEVGPRDLERGEVTLVRRDTLEKSSCDREGVVGSIMELMAEIGEGLKGRAEEWLRSRLHRARSLEEAKNIIDSRQGVVEIPWCGGDGCGLRMESEVDARVLGTPMDSEEGDEGRCPVCGSRAKGVIRLAKAY